MKLLLASLLFVGGALAQQPPTVWIPTTPPGGSGGACTPPLPGYYDRANGVPYVCPTGGSTPLTWTALGTGGGSGSQTTLSLGATANTPISAAHNLNNSHVGFWCLDHLGNWPGSTGAAKITAASITDANHVSLTFDTTDTYSCTFTTGGVGTQGNTGAAGAGYGGTSTTSLTIGTGNQTLTTGTGLAYAAGNCIIAYSTGTGAFMEGPFVSYNSGTGVLVFNSTASTPGACSGSSGSGAHTDWNIGLAGFPGQNGAGSGTVTSVGFTGGLISVGTPTSTPAFTVAGTSGGVPYFSSASTWASSAALNANGIVYGGGAGNPPASLTAFAGASTKYAGQTGSGTPAMLGAAYQIDYQRPAGAITGNSAAQTVYTTTVPIGALQSGACARYSFWSSHGSGSASVTYTVTINGGAAIVTSAATTAGTQYFEFAMCNQPGSTTAQDWAISGSSSMGPNMIGTGTSAVNTGTTAITIAYQFNVANTDTVTPKLLLGRLEPPAQ